MEQMIRQKKTAGLILHGISIIGILSGGLLVVAALGILLEMERESLAVLCGSLALSVALLAIGVYLTYTSYLLLRRRAFTVVTREIPTVLPACVFLLVEPVISWADTLPNEELARYVRLSTALVSLLLFCLGVHVCSKLAQALLKAADVPAPSGVHRTPPLVPMD